MQLRYDDPAHGIRQDDVVRFTRNSRTPPGSASWWARRLAPIMAKITYRAADHRDRDLPFAPLTRAAGRRARPVPAAAQGHASCRRSTSTRSIAPSSISSTTIRRTACMSRIRSRSSQNQPVRPFIVDRVDPTLVARPLQGHHPDEGRLAVRGAVVDDAREPDLRPARSQGASRGDPARAGRLRGEGSREDRRSRRAPRTIWRGSPSPTASTSRRPAPPPPSSSTSSILPTTPTS